MRLLLRFLLFYFVFLPIGIFLSRLGLTPYIPCSAKYLGYLPIALALAAALLTVCNTYLLLLIGAKGYYDGAVLLRIIRLTRLGEIGFFAFNACFLLLAAGLFLFLTAAVRASLFTHRCTLKNSKLLLSKNFWRLAADAAALLILSLFTTVLWQRLLLTLPFI